MSSQYFHVFMWTLCRNFLWPNHTAIAQTCTTSTDLIKNNSAPDVPKIRADCAEFAPMDGRGRVKAAKSAPITPKL